MKKFIMITPLQPAGINPETNEFTDSLACSLYKAIGNSRLQYGKETRFPLLAVINGYAEKGEEIRVITITPDTPQCQIHLKQLQEELAALQMENGFLCEGVESIPVAYAGDVDTQIEIFHKLLPCMEDNDILFGCLTYGDKPMPIAELMAIQYAYRILDNVSIDCLVYGQRDHNAPGNPMTIFDITALIKLDEIVRKLADLKVPDPERFIDQLLSR